MSQQSILRRLERLEGKTATEDRRTIIGVTLVDPDPSVKDEEGYCYYIANSGQFFRHDYPSNAAHIEAVSAEHMRVHGKSFDPDTRELDA